MSFLQPKRREERPADQGPGSYGPSGYGPGSYGPASYGAGAPGAGGPAPADGSGQPVPPPPYAYGPPVRPTVPGLKSPAAAGWLSVLFPGIGQIYVGYYQRGAAFALTMAALITVLSANLAGHMEPLFGIGIFFTYMLSIIDAHRLAHLYNRAVLGQPGQVLPEGYKLPQEGGSYAGGAVLVLLGLLLFLNRNFDISLDWLEDLWPLFVVLLGAWLIWKARKTRKS